MESISQCLVELHQKYDLSSSNIVKYLIKNHGLKIAGFLTCGYIAYKIYKRPRNLPPGPRSWPFIPPSYIKYPDAWHLDFTRMGKEYGDVFSFYFGGQ